MSTNNAAHTRGIWQRQSTIVYVLEHHGWCRGVEQFHNRITVGVQSVTAPRDELEANAELIVDAFNVANETGLTPRQLSEQRAELLEALRNAVMAMGRAGANADTAHPLRAAWDNARAAITKATGGAA